MNKGDFGFWLGIWLLIIGLLALVLYVIDLYFPSDGISLDEEDGLPKYKCCDHCYDEFGERLHVPDSHTVPCNEYNCQED